MIKRDRYMKIPALIGGDVYVVSVEHSVYFWSSDTGWIRVPKDEVVMVLEDQDDRGVCFLFQGGKYSGRRNDAQNMTLLHEIPEGVPDALKQ